MPLKLIFLVLALVLALLACLLEWPRSNPPAPGVGFGHPLGWLGLAALVASFLVG